MRGRETGWFGPLIHPSFQWMVEGERLLNFELARRRRWNRRSPSHWSSAVKKFSEKAGLAPLLAVEFLASCGGRGLRMDESMRVFRVEIPLM